ncbi:hypothetical protein JCM8547_003775 [Rhodosporidiobolus lusitaniae]
MDSFHLGSWKLDSRLSGISFDGPASVYSIPSSPRIPTSPGLVENPPARSESRASIPIFFRREDLASQRGSRVELETNPFEQELEDEDEDDDTPSLINCYIDDESVGSSRRSSTSGASTITAPTEPPSPLSPGSQDKHFPQGSPSTSYFPTALTSPPPVLTPCRDVCARPDTADSTSSTVPLLRSPPRSSSLRSSWSQPDLKHRSSPTSSAPSSSPPLPAGLFFRPVPPLLPRPHTASSTAPAATSFKHIPIRLVPPTPTSALRDIRLANSPFRRDELQRPPPSSPSSHLLPPQSLPSPPRRAPSTTAPPYPHPRRSVKPLPSLPVFPTKPRPSTAGGASFPPPSRPCPSTPLSRPPPRAQSRPLLAPPGTAPPSFPSSPPPAPLSPTKRVLRAVKSSPFLGGGGGKAAGYSRIPPSTAPPLPSFSSSPFSSSYSPTTGGSTASSLEPAFQPIPGSTTLELTIDQEGFRESKVVFDYVRTTALGRGGERGKMLEFVARLAGRGVRYGGNDGEEEGYPFHSGFLEPPPRLRRLILPSSSSSSSRDYLPREANLPVAEKDGTYSLTCAWNGKEGRGGGEPWYCLRYEVKGRSRGGRKVRGERLLKPLTFVCSPDFLHPSRGRKMGFRQAVSKALTRPSTARLVSQPSSGKLRDAQVRRPATRG